MRWHSYQSLMLRARRKRVGGRDRRGRRKIRSRLRAERRRRLRSSRRERVMIETRRCRITITRGGPHRKTQRVERSIRSRSSFCRNVAVFRADFLYAEGYTVVVLV